MSNYKHYNNYNYKFVVFLWILNQNLIRILISENIKKASIKAYANMLIQRAWLKCKMK